MDPSLRYKWLDDLTTLEVIYLLTIGKSSFNSRLQVPNDILHTNGFISNANLKTQEIVDKISQWTISKKLNLNIKKSSLMCFNFYQEISIHHKNQNLWPDITNFRSNKTSWRDHHQ